MHRPNAEDVVMIALSEYNCIKETLFLLSSEKNRKRLLKGMAQIEKENTKKVDINEL